MKRRGAGNWNKFPHFNSNSGFFSYHLHPLGFNSTRQNTYSDLLPTCVPYYIHPQDAKRNFFMPRICKKKNKIKMHPFINLFSRVCRVMQAADSKKYSKHAIEAAQIAIIIIMEWNSKVLHLSMVHRVHSSK